MADETTFHVGEQRIQKRLGLYDQIGPWAKKVVRPFLPDPHRDFYSELPFLVAAARDASGRPWATLLVGEPGFVRSNDPSLLAIDARPVPGDGLEGALAPGSPIGFLGIELATRRRNRVNGTIRSRGEFDVEVAVDQSFGNCPQYIRERNWRSASPATDRREVVPSTRLDAGLRERIARADTFFIATGHSATGGECGGSAPSHGMDASHRGGPSGFVEVVDDRHLLFPDYAGNNHFNTLGNLELDPRAGLLFVDFETGGMLQLTGRATIDWDSEDVARHAGAQRLVHFEIDRVIDLPGVLPLRWEATEESVRELEVVAKRRESEDVQSFVLAARDGQALPDFVAGQHLPIEIGPPAASEPIRRTYSLSNGPGESTYRISVKREPLGTASRLLHDRIEVGDVLRFRPPAGDFVLDRSTRPVVCVSAGIGVTPMVSMLRSHVADDAAHEILFFHVARDGAHHPLAQEIRELIRGARHALLDVSYSRPRGEDVLGRDFDAGGRLDVDRILEHVAGRDADFYLCGPVSFMAEITEGLEQAGISSSRIHSESFGPTTTASEKIP